jgi:hypothetical protein
MKLRIQGDSLRLRITPSEMIRLMEKGRIAETIHFGVDENARLTYALEHAEQAQTIAVRHGTQEIAVVISLRDALRWSSTTEIGLYGELATTDGRLSVAIEKDFACLDKSDEENADRFQNPSKGETC